LCGRVLRRRSFRFSSHAPPFVRFLLSRVLPSVLRLGRVFPFLPRQDPSPPPLARVQFWLEGARVGASVFSRKCAAGQVLVFSSVLGFALLFSPVGAAVRVRSSLALGLASRISPASAPPRAGSFFSLSLWFFAAAAPQSCSESCSGHQWSFT
jgi:hypothetical protein